MSDNSSIEWTDATWNPTRGCTKIAQGCKNCYAERFAERFRGVPGHAYEAGFDPRTAPDQLTIPLRWTKPRRIFVDSMSDLFHESFSFEYIDLVFAVMAIAKHHTYQILTKRPDRAAEYFRSFNLGVSSIQRGAACAEALLSLFGTHNEWFAACETVSASRFWRGLPHVWIGTSIAEQKDADANIPHLLQIPAAVRFLSVEPLIGPVNVQRWLTALQWVIVGGESGPGARPCHVDWITSIVEQCREAPLPVFVKQVQLYRCGHCGNCWPEPPQWPAEECGEDCVAAARRVLSKSPDEWPEYLRIREFPQEVRG